MGRIVCATGHRPEKLPWRYNENDPQCIALKQRLKTEIEKLIQHNCDYFISGMALGWDMWFAEIVIELKEKYPIKLEVAIPFKGQEKTWPIQSQNRYNKIVSNADVVSILSEGPYRPYLLISRDEYMVDKSDFIIACYDGSPGGTRHTFSYAYDKKRRIIHINPVTKEVKYIIPS